MALTNKLTAIADAIREKTGETKTYTLDEMATAIGDITGGSGSGGGYTTEENDYGTTIIIGEGGTGDQAQLNAPTIALSGRSIAITNGNNGSFQEGNKIVIDDEVAATITTSSYTIPYDTLSVGNHTAKVIATGENFTDSEASNTLAINKYSITVNATGCTASTENPTYIASGDTSVTLNFTLTDPENDTLNNDSFSITGATGVVSNSTVTILNPTGNITITVVEEAKHTMFRVGGTIFYIDSADNGATYTFYDESGSEISDVQVGDEPYYYKVTGTPTSDKFYVLYNEKILSKRWTYFEDGASVKNSLGCQSGIGRGKSNTSKVMFADEGKYITDNSYNLPTIWYAIKQMRDNYIGGCNDWFVPSKEEAEKIRTYKISLFNYYYIGTSSEQSAENYYEYDGRSYKWGNNSKGNSSSFFATRAF